MHVLCLNSCHAADFFVGFSDKVNVPTVSVSNRIIDTDSVNVHSGFMDPFDIFSDDISRELASERFNVTHCRSCLRSANRECEIRIRTRRFIFSSTSVLMYLSNFRL